MKIKCPNCSTKTELIWGNCPKCGNNLQDTWKNTIKKSKDSAISLIIFGGFFLFFSLFGGILAAGLGVLLIVIGAVDYNKIKGHLKQRPGIGNHK